jgi:hypothetical protein
MKHLYSNYIYSLTQAQDAKALDEVKQEVKCNDNIVIRISNIPEINNSKGNAIWKKPPEERRLNSSFNEKTTMRLHLQKC